MDDLICPYCGEKLYECHPFSSDALAYLVCDKCGAKFDTYEQLLDATEESGK